MSTEITRLNRREILRGAGAVAAAFTLDAMPLPWAQAAGAVKSAKNVLLLLNVDLTGVTQKNISDLTTAMASAAAGVGARLTVITTGAAFTAAAIKNADLVIYLPTSSLIIAASQGKITAAATQAFLTAVSKGKGFVAGYCRLADGQTSPTPAQQFVADISLTAASIACGIAGASAGSIQLVDHAVSVSGEVIGSTPMPLRIVCATNVTGGAKPISRPIVNLLFSNGGTMLKEVLRNASASS